MRHLTRYPFTIGWRLIAITATAVFVAAAMYHMVVYFHTVPQADDYRLTLYHIMPFFDGTWTVKRLWTDVHPNPIHGLILIASAKLESLSFASLPIWLLPFLLAKWLLAVAAFYIANPNHRSTDILIAVGCGFALITFAYNFSGQYYWNSVAIAQIYHACAGAYVVLLTLSLASGRAIYPIVLFVTALLFQLTARQYASPWLIATLPVLLLHGWLNRDRRHRVILIATLLVAVLLLERLFLNWLDVTLRYSVSLTTLLEALSSSWSHRPMELLYHVLAELAYPLVNAYNLRFNVDLSDRQTELTMLLASVIMIYTIVHCLIKIKHLNYAIPLLLFAYVGLTIVASIAHRTTPDMHWLYGHQPRYDTFRNIAVIATTWVLVINLLTHQHRWLPTILLGIWVGLFGFAQFHQTQQAWDIAQLRTDTMRRTSEQIRFAYQQLTHNPDITQEAIIDNYQAQTGRRFVLRIGESDKPGQRWVLKVIQFWGENRLAVFHDD